MQTKSSASPGTNARAAKRKRTTSIEKSDSKEEPGITCGGNGRDEAIRFRAYSLYEARGRVDGYELEDWLAAETEVNRPLGNNDRALAPTV